MTEDLNGRHGDKRRWAAQEVFRFGPRPITQAPEFWGETTWSREWRGNVSQAFASPLQPLDQFLCLANVAFGYLQPLALPSPSGCFSPEADVHCKL